MFTAPYFEFCGDTMNEFRSKKFFFLEADFFWSLLLMHACVKLLHITKCRNPVFFNLNFTLTCLAMVAGSSLYCNQGL